MINERYGAQLDADGTRFLSYITSASKRMEDLIGSLLQYSYVLGAEAVPFAPVVLADAVELAASNLKILIEDSGAAVVYGHLPTVTAHQTQLVQVFQNLIANAIRYRKATEPPRVRISVDSSDREWIVSVQDNGIGMDPQQATGIFEAFKRLHGPEIPGTGLGLAICRRIVEAHGGRIWVQSEPDVGSSFHFTIRHNTVL